MDSDLQKDLEVARNLGSQDKESSEVAKNIGEFLGAYQAYKNNNRWLHRVLSNPLAAAFLGLMVAVTIHTISSYYENKLNRELEKQKLESGLISKAIETGGYAPDSSRNLLWLQEAELISLPSNTVEKLKRDPFGAPSVVSASGIIQLNPPTHVLAASWQPSFCETRPDKIECEAQTQARFDASHFALHGLWPQPRNNVYCGVTPDLAAADKAGRWDDLPAVALEPETDSELDEVMPGTASLLERHEWIKHGTCYGDTMDAYFADSLAVMRDLNASAVRALFAENVGATLTAVQIREAFDTSFGPGAGSRVRVSCVTDPSNGRRLIGEITIGLSGEIDGEASLSDLIFAAAPTSDAGCSEGIVDAAGLQ